MASYQRSFLWRLLFFGVPVAGFYFLFWHVSTWEKPLFGPVALNEGELAEGYRTVALLLAAVGSIPYLWLLWRFSDRVQIAEDTIRSRRFLGNRTIRWNELIEYESFPNYIHLAPSDESLGLYIDYPMTFRKPMELLRVVSRKAREADANRSGRRRRRRLLVCELGLLPTIVFMVAAGLLLFFTRQRVIFLGVFSGIVLALVSAWLWVTTLEVGRGNVHYAFSASADSSSCLLHPGPRRKRVQAAGHVRGTVFGRSHGGKRGDDGPAPQPVEPVIASVLGPAGKVADALRQRGCSYSSNRA